MAPRAFERPATIALPEGAGIPGGALEGLVIPAPEPDCGGAVIAPPHPQMGGSMESPVVTEIAHAAAKAGVTSLRFNWRGVGASAGECTGDPAAAQEDYRAACEFLRESVTGRIVACGYSFGAMTAIQMAAQRPLPSKLVLVAPPTAMLDRKLLTEFSGEILLVAGDRDDYVDSEALGALATQAKAASCVILRGCDHFFMSGLADVRLAIESWWGSSTEIGQDA